ncbi:MAG: nicotinamide riboside transporter PnuC [Pseudomonadota bacterium]|nr:nicotinamide riboside transporter PnuC [Pseudomonadota bacterium]
MPFWELTAVFFGILYLVLAMRDTPWCWAAGLISTAILAVLFFTAHLYMESILQLYYVVMAFYGWRQWQYGGNNDQKLEISTWNSMQHLITLISILILSIASSLLLARYTDANYPLLDSIITWGSLITTYMVTRKVLENWLYWIALDALAIYCYLNKALYLTAGLYLFYVTLAIFGFIHWAAKKKASQHYAFNF